MKAVICPVCNGNGLVPNGFYRQTSGEWSTGSTQPETCRSCNGKGWVEVHEDNLIFTLSSNNPFEEIRSDGSPL